MTAPIPGDLELLHRICSHYKHNESALKMASLIERIAALEAQVQRLREALENALAVFDSMDVYRRYVPVRDQMSAALAAAEPKETK